MSDPSQPIPANDNPAWVNWVVLAVVIGLVYGVFHFRPFGGPAPSRHALVGRPLPILELKGLVGTDETVTLRDLEGQVVLVSFWGPWSPDCMDQLSQLASVAEAYAKRDDFRLLAVACMQPQAPEKFRQLKADTEKLLEELHLHLPVYADPAKGTRGGFEAMRASASVPTRMVCPTTLLLDRKGFVRGVWEGWRPDFEEEIRAEARQLLSH